MTASQNCGRNLSRVDVSTGPRGSAIEENNAAMSAVHGLANAGEKGPAAKVLQKDHKTWLEDAARLPAGRVRVYLGHIVVLRPPQRHHTRGDAR